jgi:thiol-disulfide isomerase/thioredoxin
MAVADDPHMNDLDGNYVDRTNFRRDRLTTLIFTRTDCPISNRYAPEVWRLYEEFHPLGVDFYLVYVDPRETPDAIRKHLAEYEYPCPALRDSEHTFAKFTGATVTPEAVLFDKNQKIVYRGRIDDRFAALGTTRDMPTTQDLADAITATLAGKLVATPVTQAIGCNIADLR